MRLHVWLVLLKTFVKLSCLADATRLQPSFIAWRLASARQFMNISRVVVVGYVLQSYWDSQLQRLDIPLLKMLKRQVRHFGRSASAAELSITVVFQASRPVNSRWMRMDTDDQNGETMIPVAGLLLYTHYLHSLNVGICSSISTVGLHAYHSLHWSIMVSGGWPRSNAKCESISKQAIKRGVGWEGVSFHSYQELRKSP